MNCHTAALCCPPPSWVGVEEVGLAWVDSARLEAENLED
jgi:hypothetical protein